MGDPYQKVSCQVVLVLGEGWGPGTHDSSAAAQNWLSVCSCVLARSSELGDVAALSSAALALLQDWPDPMPVTELLRLDPRSPGSTCHLLLSAPS